MHLRFCFLWLVAGFLLAISAPLHAQQLQGAHWFFGDSIGIDFTAGAPRYEAGGQTVLGGTTASISSPAGRMQFYTSAYGTAKFWDHQHRQFWVAPVDSPFLRSLVYVAAEWPGRPSQYLLFNSHRQLMVTHLAVLPTDSVVVVPDSAGNDVWRVRAPRLVPGAFTTIAHANGTDMWLVAHVLDSNRFLTWRLTAQGIDPTPIESAVGLSLDSAAFYQTTLTYNWVRLKSSPDGTQLALIKIRQGTVQLFGFDPATGRVHSERQPFSINHPATPLLQDTTVDGVSFSPNGRRLYLTALTRSGTQSLWSTMYQLDLSQPDDQLWPTRSVVVPPGPHERMVRAGQIGPDGRLYFTSDSTTSTTPLIYSGQLNVITCPDEPAATCGVQLGVIAFPAGNTAWQLPVLNEALFRNAGTLQLVASNPQPCVGDSVRLVAVGGGATRFVWAAGPGVPAGATGAVQTVVAGAGGPQTYAVTGESACGAGRAAQITLAPRPRPAVPPVSWAGGWLRTSAPGPYQWLRNGVALYGATAASYQPTSSGTYAVVVGAGCTAHSAEVVVTVTGLADAVPDPAAPAVWPNPAAAAVTVQAGAAGTIRLLDALGRVVRAAPVAAGETARWELDGLAPGVYVVRLGAATRRLVIEP